MPYVVIEVGATVTEVGRSADAPREEFRLVFAGETIGVLAAERRAGGLPFTAAERGLLAGLG